MSDVNIPQQIVLARFNTETGAENALHAIMQSRQYRQIIIDNVAILWKDDSGKLSFKETADMRGGKGAKIGGVIGGVVGLIFPPSILAGAAIGAAVGGLSAKLRDGGFPDDRLRQVGERLTPGTSGLIALIEKAWANRIEEMLRASGGEVATEQVRADIAAQLEAEPPIVVVPTPDDQESTASPSTHEEPPPTESVPPNEAGPNPV